jgi:hypothetical protein
MAARGSFAGRDWAVGEPAAGRPVARPPVVVRWLEELARESIGLAVERLADMPDGWCSCLDRPQCGRLVLCDAVRRDAEHAPVLAAELRGAVVEPTAKPTPATSPGPVEQTAGGRVRKDMIISPEENIYSAQVRAT